MAAGGDPRAAPGAAGRPAVPRRRRCACSPRWRSGSRPARSGSARAASRSAGTSTWVRPHGGMVGEALYWGTSTALGTVGAHIVCRVPAPRGRAAAHRRVDRRRRQGHDDSVVHHHARACGAARSRAPAARRPRSSTDARARRRRAARRTLPSAGAAETLESATGEEPEPFETAVLEPNEPSSRTSRELSWRIPRPTSRASTPAPSASRPHAAGPLARRRSPTPGDSSGRCRTRASSSAPPRRPRARTPPGRRRWPPRCVEALGHFGVEARVIGTVAGPHITRYELRLAPGIKVGKVAQLKDDLAYALAAVRHPHPGADPGQAGRRRRGPERAPPDRPPRRRLPGARRTTGRR